MHQAQDGLSMSNLIKLYESETGSTKWVHAMFLHTTCHNFTDTYDTIITVKPRASSSTTSLAPTASSDAIKISMLRRNVEGNALGRIECREPREQVRQLNVMYFGLIHSNISTPEHPLSQTRHERTERGLMHSSLRIGTP